MELPARAAGALARGAAAESREAWLARDLSRLERGYESAMGQLFDQRTTAYAGYLGNPFHDALPADGTGDGGDNGNNSNNGNNDNSNGNNSDSGSGNGNNGGGQNNNNGGDQQPPSGDGGSTVPPHRYSFLLIGEFEGVDSTTRVFRGYRNDDGSFMIQDKVRVDPMSGVVGGAARAGFTDGNLVVSDDIDGDGDVDVVLVQAADQGSVVQTFLRQPSGDYLKQVESFFLWRAIASLSLFDFNSDGRLEIGVIFRNEPNLFVFAIEGREMKYLKEIVLPFQPSVVVDSHFDGVPNERRLHVFDASFQRVVSLTSRRPSVFLLDMPGLVASVSTFQLDGEIGGLPATEVKVFETNDRVCIFEPRGQGWVTRGSFVVTPHCPLIVLGDYLRQGSRQLFWLP
jgi:hypothetical protein